MIETKITCQCGNHFKFGMELVHGRAPEGLVCPTCGAPATAACNALVDFLSGREPAPLSSTDTRPLKEVRVTCTCGARYKFDLELAEQAMPAPVVCPNCQVDLTPLANEEIRGYVAKHAPGLVASAAAGVPVAAPALVVTPAPEPVVVTAAAEPAPASPAPPAPATPLPEAAPPPASSTAAPPAPDSPPPVAPAPPAAPAPSVTPVSDPFGPAATGKSSGPNLKPLEVPKPNRPPPGSKPANPSPASPPPAKPAAPATAPAAPTGKYTPAKPTGHHNQHAHPTPAANAGEPSLGGGIGGAVGGALIGAGIWFGLLQATAIPTSWMAAVVGGLAGFGARILGRSTGPVLGGVACGVATLVICLMAWLTITAHKDRLIGPQLKAQYVAELANAQTIVKATDAELKVIIGRMTPNFGMGGPVVTVSDAEVQAYRAKELPRMRDFAAGKPSRAEWESSKRGNLRSAYAFEDIWEEAFGIVGLLFLLSGIFAAAKIPMQ